MIRSKVRTLLDDCLKERKDLFLIDFDVLSDNTIKIVIDGDHGVSVEDCMLVSRAIEHNLDREEEDFSLEVASAGATTPMSHKRQYKKNIGRTVDVTATNNQKFEAILTNANDDSIILEWKAREPKEVGKGKVTVHKKVKLAYNDIIEAKVKIKF
ncbi:MAG: ribosome assembly cofactor RimP [Flavobacteriaceae bacterium]|nr:ribosome assembly cofactor RimP [Winogradskyella sp.]